MEYQALGGTGVQVGHLCLGAMRFGASGTTDHAERVRMIRTALDAGVNSADTADVDSRCESEEIVGKALKGRRDRVVLATVLHRRMGDDANVAGNSRRWIHQACEAGRPGTDWIDVYRAHRPSPDTGLDETPDAGWTSPAPAAAGRRRSG